MFISTDFLAINYGVDNKIASFFVDRDPPKENLYWHNKLLYLRPAAGYIFIPLIADLLFKIGINKPDLLSEKFASPMEQIGHISALEETKQISYDEAIERCAHLVQHNCIVKEWYVDVQNYLHNVQGSFINQLVTPFKALHRGDVFLFALCSLDFQATIKEKIVRQWFALITTLLLLDDAEDIEEDIKSGDENAFVESGLSQTGMHRLNELIKANVQELSSVNQIMAIELQRQYRDAINNSGRLKHLN
jgi:hypothetical protein